MLICHGIRLEDSALVAVIVNRQAPPTLFQSASRSSSSSCRRRAKGDRPARPWNESGRAGSVREPRCTASPCLRVSVVNPNEPGGQQPVSKSLSLSGSIRFRWFCLGSGRSTTPWPPRERGDGADAYDTPPGDAAETVSGDGRLRAALISNSRAPRAVGKGCMAPRACYIVLHEGKDPDHQD